MQPPRVRPIQKLASTVSQCSAEAAVYGKCIVADYNSVHKDKCASEFMKLKDCYIVSCANQPTFIYIYIRLLCCKAAHIWL
ncbi:hypothetical protein GGS21DRAFT_264034 [Xylaria nigripes]|nr:hypothetical protein GGS21DRAFT_264034 [Xylaria nigripes]